MVSRPLSLAGLCLAALISTTPVLSIVIPSSDGASAYAASPSKNFRYERRTLAPAAVDMPLGAKSFSTYYRFDHRDEVSFAMSYVGLAVGGPDAAAEATVRSLYHGDRVDKITRVYSDSFSTVYEAEGYIRNRQRNFKTRVLVHDGHIWVAASSVKPSLSAKYSADIEHYLRSFKLLEE